MDLVLFFNCSHMYSRTQERAVCERLDLACANRGFLSCSLHSHSSLQSKGQGRENPRSGQD